MVLRPLAFVPLLFSLVAFILALLCVFAGSKPGFLENADLLTLDTSMLGRAALSAASKSHSSALSSVEASVKDKAVSDIAKGLHIHDFYSMHMMDYCEGYFTPSKDVTACSKTSWKFHFDPATSIQNELKSGIKLTDLQWPSAIGDAFKGIKLASNVMFVLYSMGAVTAGFVLLGSIVGVISETRYGAKVNSIISFFSLFCLMLASAISTGTIFKLTGLVNTHGKAIGLTAEKGQTFIGMTWAATLLVLFASMAWYIEIVVVRRRMMAYQ